MGSDRWGGTLSAHPASVGPAVCPGQHLGQRARVYAGSDQHLPAGRRLLPRCPRPGWRSCGGHPRGSLECSGAHQDSERLPGSGCALHDALPDVANRAGAFRSGPARMTAKASLKLRSRNPDVLTCIANLSNDEVFTPPEFADRMLDTLAEAWAADHNGANMWADPSVKFLDPCTKSGVFLRQITARLT